MNATSKRSLTLCLAGAAALSGSAASGAVVFQSFNLVLSDPGATAPDNDPTTAAISFNGTSITLGHDLSAPTIRLTSDDSFELEGKTQVNEGQRYVFGGYSQTAALLNYGDVIAPGFAAAPSGNNLLEGAATDKYIGVQTDAGYLGWVHFSYTTDGATVTLHDAAFETVAGAPLQAGVVPEASTMGLAGLAGGLACLRRRRRQAA